MAAIADSPRALVMNQDMVNEGRSYFTQNYRDSGSNPSFLNDLVVNWTDFAAAVATLSANEPTIPEDRLGLRFIHRYNTTTNCWYVTVQLCFISGSPLPDPDPNRRYESYQLVCFDNYFDIMDGGVIAWNGSTGLSGTVSQRWCPEYFNNVYYGNNKVVQGSNVQSVTYSWFALQKLRTDNSDQLRPNDQLFSIVFSSSAYKATLPSPETDVEYPHCVVAYMKYDGINCLDNGFITLGKFMNKAADYNTGCPKRCAVFLWNSDIPRPA
ncbi:MAG: hypothetical protein KF744_07520 [Taibaiella sp.]|nr:hypothetical protein [Taibaiella sp.]